jgi:hypothetical protein
MDGESEEYLSALWITIDTRYSIHFFVSMLGDDSFSIGTGQRNSSWNSTENFKILFLLLSLTLMQYGIMFRSFSPQKYIRNPLSHAKLSHMYSSSSAHPIEFIECKLYTAPSTILYTASSTMYDDTYFSSIVSVSLTNHTELSGLPTPYSIVI